MNKKMFKITDILLDDKKTWDLICTGFTIGVFQLDSAIGAKVAKMVSPRNIIELAHCLALQRPPCLIKDEQGKSVLDKYAAIKWGSAVENYICDDLRTILGNTLSLIIFQEQLIEIAHKIAGYTLQDADVLRAAVGHKIEGAMKLEEERFICGVKKSGHGEDVAAALWKNVENASSYLFNYSHAIEYAHLTYQTAYLKAHYPAQFITSLLMFSKYDAETEKEVEKYYNEGKRLGINLLPPLMERLNEDFEMIDENNIAFGLSHIKGIGVASIKKIKKNFDKKFLNNFITFVKFFRDFKINKGVAEALIMSGALDCFKTSRKYMFNIYNLILSLTKREENIMWDNYNKTNDLLICIKDIFSNNLTNKKRCDILSKIYNNIMANDIHKEYSLAKILFNEKKYLNVTLSDSMANCLSVVKDRVTHDLLSLGLCVHKEKVIVGGVVEGIREILTKKKDKMAFVSISDASYKTDVVIFPAVWDGCKSKIEGGSVLLIWGLADGGKVIAQKIEAYEVSYDRKK